MSEPQRKWPPPNNDDDCRFVSPQRGPPAKHQPFLLQSEHPPLPQQRFSTNGDTDGRSIVPGQSIPKGTTFLRPPVLAHFRHLQLQQQKPGPHHGQSHQKQDVYLHPAVQGCRRRGVPQLLRFAVPAVENANAATATAAVPSRSVKSSKGSNAPGKGGKGKACIGVAPSSEEFAPTEDALGEPQTVESYTEEQQETMASECRSRSSKQGFLCEALRRSLADQGLGALTQVQRRAFPHIVAGRSALIRSPTGTGKTLAYVLPLLQRLHQQRWPCEEPVLVITPTRELAEQVAAQFYRFRGNIDCHVVVAVGGPRGGPPLGPVLLQQRGAHVLIGTPGRVQALAEAGQLLHLEQLQCLVLDEADKLVGPSFEEPIKVLLSKLNSKRQTILASATMPKWLSKQIQDAFGAQQQDQKEQEEQEQLQEQQHQQQSAEAVLIDLTVSSGSQLSPSVSHFSARVPRAPAERARRAALLLMQRLPPEGQCIIFCCSRDEVSLLAAHPLLQQQQARPLHAEMPQQLRRHTVSQFRAKQFSVLIASDLAARGLDFPGVRLVLQWGPPLSPEVYIHRVGRTGRGGEQGDAVVLYDEAQRRQLRRLERQLKISFTPTKTPSEEEVRKQLLDRLEADIVSFPFASDLGPLLQYASVQSEQWGPRLLAAGLALLLQRQQRISWISCLSGRQNYVAILFYDPMGKVLKTRSDLLQLLREVLSQQQLALLGRIALCSEGFVVDVPPSVAAYLKKAPRIKQAGLKLSFLSSLPPVLQQQHVTREELERRRSLQRRTGTNPPLGASAKARRRIARRLARQREATIVRQTLRQRLQHKGRQSRELNAATATKSDTGIRNVPS
ncbi:uncharacterized protein LOC34618105 [Cyclospora cayetanensis]|uniref:Uncharacterized protein LOC34618105 n=1 Tax=Cyclospora cayetanensis TaxID=88456 RepID=A0A6P6RTA6_9EIME|nr:uncharacterized protein LOC34618105 [Cyclospora cayetanensis]